MSAAVDAVVEKTYHALLSIVHTTAVSKRVLMRPPFTFLHKLLVETLEQHCIFTAQQLVFCELVTKEDKAAFLTRALAFVSFAMTNLNVKAISVLLLVSPVKVLAGVSIEDTLDFLQQLCVVCNSTDRVAKESAAREVLAKGDAQLYTSGVTFRKGLVLIQAITRAFISRRIGKRKHAYGNAIMNRALGGAKAVPFHHGLYKPGAPQSMEVGTKFLKELSNGRVYDGVIAAVRGKRFILRYEQDVEVEDNIDEIEMKILLEESVHLHKQRERMHSPQKARQQDDTDLALTSLPDLNPVDEGNGRPKSSMRHSSSRDLLSQGLTLSSRPSLMRSMSARQALGGVPTPSADLEPPTCATQKSVRPRSSTRSKLERTQTQLSEEEDKPHMELDATAIEDVRDETPQVPAAEKPWQASLKKILARGLVDMNGEAAPRRNQPTNKDPGDKTLDNRTPRNNGSSLSIPVFPELTIPGKKKIPAAIQKRKQPTAGFTPSSIVAIAKPLPNCKPSNGVHEKTSSSSTPSHHSVESLRPAVGAARLPAMPASGDVAVDKAFGGAYQSTDHKAQEKLALFREIVSRIDGYMKRKRLRVIDLFRFCDADGNGSISPQEMIDTLSQMEIQLSPEQANEFIEYIDKDGNGAIDVDEFEELLRVARRSEAQREQLKKELAHSKKTTTIERAKTTGNRYATLLKHRNRILEELKALDIGDVGAVSGPQAKATILRLQLAGVDDAVVNELLERSRPQVSPLDDAPPSALLDPFSSPSIDQAAVQSVVAADTTIYLQHIAKALHDLEWTKKTNRFLDQSWLAQFDSQVERAFRDFELL